MTGKLNGVIAAATPSGWRRVTDPADTGPVVIALPQHVQVETFEFPAAMFAPGLHRVPRPAPDVRALTEAVDILRSAHRPLLIIGGGVRYAGAGPAVLAFAERHGIPVADTPAGRTLVPHGHPLYAGPLGIVGSRSANVVASEADVVLAIGTRLEDFATSSWTLFAQDMRLVSINAARFDAVKHAGHAVVGDALVTIEALLEPLEGWSADAAWSARPEAERGTWDAYVDELRAQPAVGGGLTYAQVVGAINELSGPEDYVVTSAGGLPGELHGGWRTAVPGTPGSTAGATMDLEYGFSCMGYEISGAWGAAIARSATNPDGLVTGILGDGSYLILNGDLFSAAFAGHAFVAVVCDNGGYAVIHRLQTSQGAAGFNNQFEDATGPGARTNPVRVDFAMHARALGCGVERRSRGWHARGRSRRLCPRAHNGASDPTTCGRRVSYRSGGVDRGRLVRGRRPRRPVGSRRFRAVEASPVAMAGAGSAHRRTPGLNVPDTGLTGDVRPDEPAVLQSGSRLREALDVGSFAHVVELVPWRGSLDAAAGAQVRALAGELHQNKAITSVSITDSAGGHAMLSPEVLAGQLAARGQESIVHVTCRDRNRSELLSLGWRLASAGIENLLVLSGDYPTEGYLGAARPVFDLDSVSLLALYEASNRGAIGQGIVGRMRIRDRARTFPELDAAPGYAHPPAPTDFLLGGAINPFKRLESELVPQYLKLAAKARAGARFAITQVGYDPRCLDELARYVANEALPIQLLSNVFVLSRTTARVFASGDVPGVEISPALLELVEREAASADKGRAYFVELAARQVAIARGLGYAGAYIGGTSKAAEIERIIERTGSFAPDDWREFVKTDSWPVPGTFRLFQTDGATGLASEERQPLARPKRVPMAYRTDRLIHRLVFKPGTAGFRAAAHLYAGVERARLGHLSHVAEQAVKIPLFDCRDCGDCSLPEIAYLCPESQCVKNQRNGPCGGSLDGECEIPGKACIWTRAYERLKPYGEAQSMLDRPPTIPDHALRRTSAWANTFLGRHHAGRPPAEGPRGER